MKKYNCILALLLSLSIFLVITSLFLVSRRFISNVVNKNEYYKTAKYASKCVYHNNSGNENPIDPETGSNTSISTTAIMSEAAYEQVNHLDDSNNNIWNYLVHPGKFILTLFQHG